MLYNAEKHNGVTKKKGITNKGHHKTGLWRTTQIFMSLKKRKENVVILQFIRNKKQVGLKFPLYLPQQNKPVQCLKEDDSTVSKHGRSFLILMSDVNTN